MIVPKILSKKVLVFCCVFLQSNALTQEYLDVDQLPITLKGIWYGKDSIDYWICSIEDNFFVVS